MINIPLTYNGTNESTVSKLSIHNKSTLFPEKGGLNVDLLWTQRGLIPRKFQLIPYTDQYSHQ